MLTIAPELGYASLGPFNRAFKAATGTTPSDYRQQKLGQHADYDNASRVLHEVVGLDQRNLEGLEIVVETLVFLKSEGELAREYRVSCITGATRDLVRFRIANAG